MNSITTVLMTEALFSDDGTKRYLLRKVWDGTKPDLAVVMMCPAGASGVELDQTSMLVLNNASRLGYGSVSIMNLFATLNDFSLKQAEQEDAENLNIILEYAEKANAIVYAPGVGKASNKVFQMRQQQVLTALQPMEEKLFCLCGADGQARLQHPLSPAVRTWQLSPLKTKELLPQTETQEKEQEKPVKPKGNRKKDV